MALAIALGVFFLLGQPGDYDATAKMAAIRSAFHISPVLFLPLVVVVVLALFRFPPFTAIFLGALAGGVLAVVVAPERVISVCRRRRPAVVAGAAQGRLARAGERVHVDHRRFAPMDMLATRGGMDSMLNTIWLIVTALAFGGVVEKAGVLERLITPIIERAKSDGALVASLVVLDHRDQHHHRRPVHRHRAAGADVQERVRAARARAGGAVARRRRYGDADVGADPLEQLRRLHGGDAGRGHLELRTLRGLQHRQPAADGRPRLRRLPHAAPPACAAGSVGTTPAPVHKDPGT